MAMKKATREKFNEAYLRGVKDGRELERKAQADLESLVAKEQSVLDGLGEENDGAE